MLGVNVAKSSLHLHFLKTLEFRTDLSVTGMPGAARAIKACRFLPPHTPVGRKTCHLALRRRFHLMLIVHYLYHVLGYHI
uniref:Uncharacterized protein n=2 Tax=Canis lupus TaxID=9612 RepID=A0A8C0RFX6_CANLF